MVEPRVPFALPADNVFFYASDLSDITSSEDDEEFIPNTAKMSSVKKPNRDLQPYTVPSYLRPLRSTSYLVRDLYGPSFSSLSSSAHFASIIQSSVGQIEAIVTALLPSLLRIQRLASRLRHRACTLRFHQPDLSSLLLQRSS